MKIVAAVALVVAMAAVASAECPNACSGNGICGKNDMCVCDRNFQGSDCSERVCPYGHAFITTPQGDLNMDGDRDDNSWKRLSSTIATFLRDTERLTFENNLRSYDQVSTGLGSTEDNNLEDGVVELEAGDKIKVGDEVFTVKTKVSDKIYDMTTHAKQTWTGYQAYKFISTQARPQGTWEMWPGDFPGSGSDAAEDEGHYYMECSNRGLCDRKTGECECFDGYTGIGCTRQSCPEGCSGHGQCDTVESLRVSQPTKLSITVQTEKDDAVVFTSGPHTLQENDFVKIGNHDSMKILSVGANKDRFTLENEFPHTLPFGTEIWQEHRYDLWDSNKNRACKCDPMWTGNDCSLRKCPFGDDPLTVTSMDPLSEGDSATSTDTSPYEQKAEKQSLWVESTSGRLTGTFTLTFTDEYGDKWETLPIPNKVRLSQYGSTGASDGVVTFDDAGVLPDEIGINDYIMLGQDLCRVSKLTWKNTQTKTHYSKAHCAVAKAVKGSLSSVPVYRVTVAKEIRDALRALPNNRIPDVTVEAITSQGRYAFTENDADNSDKNQATLDNSAFSQNFVVGDYARIGKDIRYVKTVTLDHDGSGGAGTKDTIVFNTGIDLSVEADGLPVFRQNGFRYDILFEYGCRTHWDCQNNGVDQNDSDGPPASSSTDVGVGAASCHPGGACQCSDDSAFGGNGCTKDRRTSHANARVSVSGNLANLVCDSAGLTPSAVLASTGNVARVTPLTITSTADESSTVLVGDQVRMENQVRTVVAISGTAITVDRHFEEDEFSTDTHIFPAKTPIVFVESKEKVDGMVVQCFATDLPPLLTSTTNCASTDGGKANGCGTGQLANIDGDNVQRKVNIEGGTVVDIRELEVGDRVRIYDASKLGQQWNTRTVDSITLTNAVPTAFTVSESLSFSNGNTKRVFVDNSGTTEEKSCSNRGLCDESTGECQCFNGYTDVDCSKQNALAL